MDIPANPLWGDSCTPFRGFRTARRIERSDPEIRRIRSEEGQSPCSGTDAATISRECALPNGFRPLTWKGASNAMATSSWAR